MSNLSNSEMKKQINLESKVSRNGMGKGDRDGER